MAALLHRILIVGSRTDTRASVRQLVEELGHHVKCARTGHGALLMSIAWPPDLMVLDLSLSDPSGTHVAEMMKRRPRPPIIIGFGSCDALAKAAGNPAFDVVMARPAFDCPPATSVPDHRCSLEWLERLADDAFGRVLRSRLLVMRSTELVGRARWMVMQSQRKARRRSTLGVVAQTAKRRRRAG
jgi:CheY-like chemotaxis protein